MGTRRLLAVAVWAAAALGLSANVALAGEVKGPPGTPDVAFSGSGESTAARANSNSICSYSGLNDMNPEEGPIDRIVQTPADGPPGAPGHGTCAGGSNPNRDK